MYTAVEHLFNSLSAPEKQRIVYLQDDMKLATAVLLYRVIHVDGRERSEEVSCYRHILTDHLQVSEDELELFQSVVEGQSLESDGLDPFIKTIRRMPMKEKQQILEMMQDISISDREYHEVELNLLGKVAKLIGIEE